MNKALEYAKKIAYSYEVTLLNTYNLSQELIASDIEGDFVECGVAAGAQIIAMQSAIQESGSNKEIFAYDSFEGIPMAGEFDTEQAGIGEIKHNKFAPIKERLVSSGVTVHSMQNVKNNFENAGLPISNVHFVKGWFQDSLPIHGKYIRHISLLRLDGDLYESTLVCLEHLYSKVVDGGVVIIDDYALEGCKVAVKHFFGSIGQELPEMFPVEGGGGVVYFRK